MYWRYKPKKDILAAKKCFVELIYLCLNTAFSVLLVKNGRWKNNNDESNPWAS